MLVCHSEKISVNWLKNCIVGICRWVMYGKYILATVYGNSNLYTARWRTTLENNVNHVGELLWESCWYDAVAILGGCGESCRSHAVIILFWFTAPPQGDGGGKHHELIMKKYKMKKRITGRNILNGNIMINYLLSNKVIIEFYMLSPN